MRWIEIPVLASFIWLASCANPVAPTGGPKDTTPPRLDTSESTPNFQTNFEKQTIVLAFDEFVQLQQPNQNVVVSPPLEHPLEFTIRSASVRISFDSDETLRPNTTYTVNMSNAVKDLNEGNPAEDIRFVFSTGTVIDSLQLRATVMDALSGEPAGGVYVFLYDRMADSVIYTEKPYYFAQTDESGIASLQNLKEGMYKMVALEDVNRNLIYDLPEERLGFLDQPVRVDTSSLPPESIRISSQDPPLVITKKIHEHRGAGRVAFNRSPGSLQVRGPEADPLFALYADSLYLWWEDLERDSVAFEIRTESYSDTLVFSGPGASSPPPLILRETKKTVFPPVRLLWNQPIDSVRTALILRKDSTPASDTWSISVGGSADDQLVFSPRKRYSERDTLLFLPGAVKGRFDTLGDSLKVQWQFQPPEALANLTIIMDSLQAGEQYLARLVEEKDRQEEIARTHWNGLTQYSWKVEGLIPKAMVIELILDRNRNGRWDPVRYDAGLQAEPIYRKKILNLRANWDVELTLDEPL